MRIRQEIKDGHGQKDKWKDPNLCSQRDLAGAYCQMCLPETQDSQYDQFCIDDPRVNREHREGRNRRH